MNNQYSLFLMKNQYTFNCFQQFIQSFCKANIATTGAATSMSFFSRELHSTSPLSNTTPCRYGYDVCPSSAIISWKHALMVSILVTFTLQAYGLHHSLPWLPILLCMLLLSCVPPYSRNYNNGCLIVLRQPRRSLPFSLIHSPALGRSPILNSTCLRHLVSVFPIASWFKQRRWPRRILCRRVIAPWLLVDNSNGRRGTIRKVVENYIDNVVSLLTIRLVHFGYHFLP